MRMHRRDVYESKVDLECAMRGPLKVTPRFIALGANRDLRGANVWIFRHGNGPNLQGYLAKNKLCLTQG